MPVTSGLAREPVPEEQAEKDVMPSLDCTGLRDRFGAVSPGNTQQTTGLRGTGRGGPGIWLRPPGAWAGAPEKTILRPFSMASGGSGDRAGASRLASGDKLICKAVAKRGITN